MKELYSKAKNIANSTGKSFSKLAMLTMLGTGLVVGSGLSKNVSAGDNVMSKGVHEMSPEEYSQYNYNKSTTDYHNTPEDERDESLQDYQLRTGWGVMDAEDKPKTKDDEVNEKRERRSGRDYHTVQEYEFLSDIAKKYNLTIEELKELNNMESNGLVEGQRLRIVPRKYHTVQEYEFLSDIAKKYNLTIEELKELNNMESNGLVEGQKLIVNP